MWMQITKQQLVPDMEKRLLQIGKGVCQGGAFSPWLCNLYAEYIMRNARLDEAQLELRLP